MKKSFIVENDKIIFRRARNSDNFDDMALVIYDTDPYIYPFWFNNDKKHAQKIITQLINTEGSIFHYDNLYIAYDVTIDKVIGVLCGIDYTVDFSYNYEDLMNIDDNHKITIEKYIRPVVDEVRNNKFMYISNICVDGNYRGKKIGSYLLGYFISHMEKHGYNTFSLDCLLHNLRARNLYHSFNFKEMELYTAFNGTDTSNIEAVRMTRKKGTYMPEEFQAPTFEEGGI